jgi:hypothetical protein
MRLKLTVRALCTGVLALLRAVHAALDIIIR